MKTITCIKSNIKPEELDLYSSESSVFVRKNIQEVTEFDPVFNTEDKLFIYDEDEYTFKEWAIKTITELRERINVLESGE